jgi:hypothetical protein
MTDDRLANLVVRSGPWPKVGRRSARNSRDPRQRRCAQFLIDLHEAKCPAPQVVEQLIELGMQCVVLRNLSVGLLHILDDVDNLTQDLIERCDSIVR